MIHIKRIAFLLLCISAMMVISLWTNVASAKFSSVGRPIPQVQRPEGGPPMQNTISITLTPGLVASLVYTDAQGLPTQFDFPGNAITQTTTIILTPELLTSPRPDFILTGHAFELVASHDGQLDKAFVFSAPVTVTVRYSNNDVQTVPNEDQLTLYWWSGYDWLDAVNTCSPASFYIREPNDNRISISFCSPGQLGLFATNKIYLPIVFR